MARKLISSSVVPSVDNTQTLQTDNTKTVIRKVVSTTPVTDENSGTLSTFRKLSDEIEQGTDISLMAAVDPIAQPTQELDDDILKLLSELNEGPNPSSDDTSFTLSFTNDNEYDLDEIISKIRRDNPNEPLVMQVNFENKIIQTITARMINELLELYNTNSINFILDFNNVFLKYFREHATQYTLEAKKLTIEGGLAIDEKQIKTKVEKADLKKYLFNEKPSNTPTLPSLDLSKSFGIWTEIGYDGTEDSDFDDIELYEQRIRALQERIDELLEYPNTDGGDFEDDLDGGDFLEEEYEEEENGGDF
jgi:hypothetical protein